MKLSKEESFFPHPFTKIDKLARFFLKRLSLWCLFLVDKIVDTASSSCSLNLMAIKYVFFPPKMSVLLKKTHFRKTITATAFRNDFMLVIATAIQKRNNVISLPFVFLPSKKSLEEIVKQWENELSARVPFFPPF